MSEVRPDHYKQNNKEVWEMMLDIWGPAAFIAYCEINAFKYRMRAGRKPNNPIEQDILKAQWYEGKASEIARSQNE
jgi:amino acid permease